MPNIGVTDRGSFQQPHVRATTHATIYESPYVEVHMTLRRYVTEKAFDEKAPEPQQIIKRVALEIGALVEDEMWQMV